MHAMRRRTHRGACRGKEKVVSGPQRFPRLPQCPDHSVIQASSRRWAEDRPSSLPANERKLFLTHCHTARALQIPALFPRHFLPFHLTHPAITMCPSIEETPANGTNGHSNGDASQFTAIEARANPAPHHKSSPYQPVGDFLSNISRFKIIESTLREGEQFAKCVPPPPDMC